MTHSPDDAAIARAARARGGTPFLTPEQAAYYLGISVRTLQGYRSAGTGPHYRRHSRHVRYHIDDLDAWSQRPAKDDGHD
jgi:excisionase family DNA binding protein